MYKKAVMIVITVVFIIGCDLFKKDSGNDIDNSVEIVLKSKPVSQNADKTVYFRYLATKENLKESDFLYSYTLSKISGTSSEIIYKYPETGTYGPNYEAEFKKLINGKSYVFKVRAYNVKNNSYSKELSYEFKIRYDYKFNYGIVSDSSNIYGEATGILKKGQTFKVYANLINSDTTATETLLKSENVTLKLDLSDFIGATISSDSKIEQSFEVNSTLGAVWVITAPIEKVKGNIKLELLDTPHYNVSNIPVIDDSTGISIATESRIPGDLTILNFIPETSSIAAGGNLNITISFKNSGDSNVDIKEADIVIYDSLSNEISSQWSTTNSIKGLTIEGNTTISKTVSYTISKSSDLGDVYILFKCKGSESVSKKEIEIESEQKTVFITSQ
jgi:hypothetical protein